MICAFQYACDNIQNKLVHVLWYDIKVQLYNQPLISIKQYSSYEQEGRVMFIS